MKTVTVRDLQKNVKDCVDEAQEDRVIITRRGRPAAVRIGGEDKDWEAVVQQTDPAFWKLIGRRRRQPTLSLDQMRARVGTSRR